MSNKRTTVLQHQLQLIENLIPKHEQHNPDVSKSSIGWHLHHSLMVINGVCGILLKTKPENYKSNFNLKRMILFPLGYLPRGKAKAPKKVLPPNTIESEGIENQLKMAKTLIKNAKLLPKKSHFIHHIFGMLNRNQTLRFLEIHTNHHLKIVNDILKK